MPFEAVCCPLSLKATVQHATDGDKAVQAQHHEVAAEFAKILFIMISKHARSMKNEPQTWQLGMI